MKEEELKEKIEEIEEILEDVDATDKKVEKKSKKSNKEIENLKSQIEKLECELNLEKEKVLRNSAELQNFKRRKSEEVSVMLKYANEDLVTDLLSVIDNFERAIKLDDNDLSDEVSKFLSGFKMIYGNFNNILKKYEVMEIEALGLEFDPSVHQAVLMEHDETKPAGVVIEVLQKGYKYKDKVIRPAMVKVNE